MKFIEQVYSEISEFCTGHEMPAVSPFGWTLSPEQLAVIGELAKGVICFPDNDKAEAFAPFAHALSRVV